MKQILNEIDYECTIQTLKRILEHFQANRKDEESHKDWFVGITDENADEEYILNQIRKHANSSFQNLDKTSIGIWEVRTAEIAIAIEKQLTQFAFERGDEENNLNEGEIIYIYVFRKGWDG